jgi:hypothetical protein
MLYFFSAGKAVISHGLTKEGRVPDRDIKLAITRKAIFELSPNAHIHRE